MKLKSKKLKPDMHTSPLKNQMIKLHQAAQHLNTIACQEFLLMKILALSHSTLTKQE
jgi:hypothetical protein